MNLEEAILKEELKLSSGNEAIDTIFRRYLNQVFSDIELKKIDRFFNKNLTLNFFSQKSNVMAFTKGTKIYVNEPLFKKIDPDKAMTYIMHELFHVLYNSGNFQELNLINKQLYIVVKNDVPKNKISDFLTGKHQNIHSDWKLELINYLCNNSINWEIAKKGTKFSYKSILMDSGIFNMSSSFWKRRLY